MLHPSSMALGLEETLELSVFAFPLVEGLVDDVIMCRCVLYSAALRLPDACKRFQ